MHPAHDFVKVGWQRWRLRSENPLKGYVVLCEEDETSLPAAGWAADELARRAVATVVAFYQGRPVAQVSPDGHRTDLPKYPKDEHLVIDFRLVGRAKEGYHNNELDFVAFKGRRSVGRVLKVPTETSPN